MTEGEFAAWLAERWTDPHHHAHRSAEPELWGLVGILVLIAVVVVAACTAAGAS